MLSPSANDPNRKKELERKRSNPEDWGPKKPWKPQPGEQGRLPADRRR